MISRAMLAAALLLTLPLSGCLGGSEDDGAVETATEEGALNTTAPEGRGNIVAFEETNETEEGSGGVDHHHDYWAGRDRVQIFETHAAMEPLPGSDNRAYATFRPPQGTFLYEATERVEFTITNPQRHVCAPLIRESEAWMCNDRYAPETGVPDPNPPTGLKLRYKHAATTEWIDAGGIAWDVPLEIKITNPIQTDMPHATSSVWEFQVISPNAHDVTLSFDAKADMIRGGVDIPMWPGHPLFYDEDRPNRIVVDEVQAVACDGRTGCTMATGQDTSPVTAERIISYGTRSLYVWVNITDVQAPNPATQPSSWYLRHNNATGENNATDLFDAENYGFDKRELFWILPVDDNGMDSPYADGSRWKFSLGASYTTPDNPAGYQVSFYGGVGDFVATYTITAIATPEELPADQYHMYCLQDGIYCGPPADDAG